MAKRSVAYNEKEDKVHIVQGDIREATSFFEAASFDVVTSNPPYLNQSNGRVSEASHKAIARHELFCTFEDVVKAAAKLLRAFLSGTQTISLSGNYFLYGAV